MLFINKAPNNYGFVNPHDIEQMWRDQFDWIYREYEYAVFPIAIHPDVLSRPHVLMILERLYGHMIRHRGVRFYTMNEVADNFARRSPARSRISRPADLRGPPVSRRVEGAAKKPASWSAPLGVDILKIWD